MVATYDPKKIETSVLDFWQKQGIRSQVKQQGEDRPKFFFVDGPPYLTGPPHLGQMQNKVTKDVVLRYKRMCGYKTWDQPGFDTHGLPNELKTEQELGIDSKKEIGNSISVAQFIDKCKQRAVSAQDVWKKIMGRLAVWQDFDDPYLTFEPDYMESEWWFIKQAADKGMLYKDKRPIYWCPSCMTSLSGYEVTDEFREIEDTSIFVKFPLENRDNTSLLIWTTTPWTIPANVAIFVHPDFQYAQVEVDKGKEKETLIIAEDLVQEAMEAMEIDDSDYKIIGTFAGASLQGKSYSHPLQQEVPALLELEEDSPNVHTVLASADLVTLEEGTGLVHAATGHGPEDFEAAKEYNIPIFSPVDREGVYTEQAGKYAGQFVYDADSDIVADLENSGHLAHQQEIKHEYPHCWRCKSKLIYRATEQYFLDTSQIKQRMLEANQNVEWFPEHAGSKRFRNWLANAEDWCISRQNYWGTPLPIWECTNPNCDHRDVIGSFDQLEDKLGRKLDRDEFDPHKHVVDDFSWECDECGAEMKRVEHIIDVWCDSGCAPFASLHYPFEKEPFNSLWPMDFVVEGSDQIRGWFYTLLYCGVTAFDQAPYKQVLLQAFVLDEAGHKMSKSLGNVIDPQDILDDLGADLPRFWILENSPQWENPKVDLSEIRNKTYRLFSVYWNMLEFYEEYEPLSEGKESISLRPEDRWIRSRVHSALSHFKQEMDNYQFHQVCRQLNDLILEDLSRWYLKGVRDRAKEGDEACLATLRQVMLTITKCLAPISPFVSEEVYQRLGGPEASVHMEQYPEADEDQIDEELENKMELVREITEKLNGVRQQADLKLRWPLPKAIISAPEQVREKIKQLDYWLQDFAHVKELEFGAVEIVKRAEPDYSVIGPKFKDKAETVARLITEMEEEEIKQLQDQEEIYLDDYLIKQEDVQIKRRPVGSLSGTKFSQGEVYLQTEQTQELREESFVRELIREIQLKRKDLELDPKQEVALYLKPKTEQEETILRRHEDLIRSRVVLSQLAIKQEIDPDLASGHVELKDKAVNFALEV